MLGRRSLSFLMSLVKRDKWSGQHSYSTGSWCACDVYYILYLYMLFYYIIETVIYIIENTANTASPYKARMVSYQQIGENVHIQQT